MEGRGRRDEGAVDAMKKIRSWIFPWALIALFPLLGILMAIAMIVGVPGISRTATDNLLKIGSNAPEFEATTLAGQTVRLSDYKGTIVALSFWATWCEPCKAEMPELQKTSQRYPVDKVRILAVNAGETKTVIESYLKDLEFTYPVLLDLDQSIRDRYRVPVLPVTVWIDAKGIVVAEHIGALDEKLIDQYIALASK
jgi:thiol-disulfide isomerase/thioredoxin